MIWAVVGLVVVVLGIVAAEVLHLRRTVAAPDFQRLRSALEEESARRRTWEVNAERLALAFHDAAVRRLDGAEEKLCRHDRVVAELANRFELPPAPRAPRSPRPAAPAVAITGPSSRPRKEDETLPSMHVEGAGGVAIEDEPLDPVGPPIGDRPRLYPLPRTAGPPSAGVFLGQALAAAEPAPPTPDTSGVPRPREADELRERYQARACALTAPKPERQTRVMPHGPSSRAATPVPPPPRPIVPATPPVPAPPPARPAATMGAPAAHMDDEAETQAWDLAAAVKAADQGRAPPVPVDRAASTRRVLPPPAPPPPHSPAPRPRQPPLVGGAPVPPLTKALTLARTAEDARLTLEMSAPPEMDAAGEDLVERPSVATQVYTRSAADPHAAPSEHG